MLPNSSPQDIIRLLEEVERTKIEFELEEQKQKSEERFQAYTAFLRRKYLTIPTSNDPVGVLPAKNVFVNAGNVVPVSSGSLTIPSSDYVGQSHHLSAHSSVSPRISHALHPQAAAVAPSTSVGTILSQGERISMGQHSKEQQFASTRETGPIPLQLYTTASQDGMKSMGQHSIEQQFASTSETGPIPLQLHTMASPEEMKSMGQHSLERQFATTHETGPIPLQLHTNSSHHSGQIFPKANTTGAAAAEYISGPGVVFVAKLRGGNAGKSPVIGWATNKYGRNMSRQTKFLTTYKKCLGVYKCPHCDFVERPRVPRKSHKKNDPPRPAQKKCITHKVTPELISCECIIKTQEVSTGWIVSCQGIHQHPRPPPITLNQDAYNEFAKWVKVGPGIKPKNLTVGNHTREGVGAAIHPALYNLDRTRYLRNKVLAGSSLPSSLDGIMHGQSELTSYSHHHWAAKMVTFACKTKGCSSCFQRWHHRCRLIRFMVLCTIILMLCPNHFCMNPKSCSSFQS